MSPSPARRSLLLAAVGWSALAVAANAQDRVQDRSAPPTAQLDDVIVTGSPFRISARASTIAVDVLDEQALLSAPAATLGDALNGMPGVRSSSFSAGASRPVIRGLSGPRVQVLTNGLGMIDASALSPDHQVAADPGEAKRIEVLRGPQALAFGGSAIGGVVNVIDDRIAEERPENGLKGACRPRPAASTTATAWAAPWRSRPVRWCSAWTPCAATLTPMTSPFPPNPAARSRPRARTGKAAAPRRWRTASSL